TAVVQVRQPVFPIPPIRGALLDSTRASAVNTCFSRHRYRAFGIREHVWLIGVPGRESRLEIRFRGLPLSIDETTDTRLSQSTQRCSGLHVSNRVTLIFSPICAALFPRHPHAIVPIDSDRRASLE